MTVNRNIRKILAKVLILSSCVPIVNAPAWANAAAHPTVLPQSINNALRSDAALSSSGSSSATITIKSVPFTFTSTSPHINRSIAKAKSTLTEYRNKRKCVATVAAVETTQAIERKEIGLNLIKYSADTIWHMDSADQLRVDSGNILVMAGQPLQVNVGAMQIQLAKDTAVHIVAREGVTKIRNLHESRAQSASLKLVQTTHILRAGEELLVGKSLEKIVQSASSDHVKRRHMHCIGNLAGQEMLAVKSEFSPITAMKHDYVLKSVSYSSDLLEQKTFHKMMKMAACLALLTNQRGQFMQVSAPEPERLAQAIRFSR